MRSSSASSPVSFSSDLAVRRLSAAALLVLSGASASACDDPVADGAVAALGPEHPDVPPGPLHRPGQPCGACHDGHRARRFSVAGTVWRADAPAASRGIEIEVRDTVKQTFVLRTNCVGNFFLEGATAEPVFPLFVRMRAGEGPWSVMESPIAREPSCAACHGPVAHARSVGPLVLPGGASEDCR